MKQFKKKIVFISFVIIWIACTVLVVLAYYANHYLPKGEMIYTGETVCMNDDRGPCSPEAVEDLNSQNIPNWAKFFKNDTWILPLIGLIILGIFASTKIKMDKK
ncbi:MAG: hypothetical protein WCG99_04070 [Candidatus Berkelbacteria bacterium]